MEMPLSLLFIFQCPQQVQEGPIEALAAPISLGMIRGGPELPYMYVKELPQLSYYPRFKIPALVRMQSFREAIVDKILLPQNFSYSDCLLITGRDGLGIPGEMVCNISSVPIVSFDI
jgi:hypothetical protein